MDRKKVIEGLENLRETIRTATQYTFTSGGICAMSMKRIDNAIALLKEQEVVRCKDCKYFEPDGIYTMCYRHNGLSPNADWYCADGEREGGKANE